MPSAGLPKSLKTSSTEDIENKMEALRSRIGGSAVHFSAGHNLLTLRRDHILQDSMDQFGNLDNRMELKTCFEGENTSAASDAGGMTKEWFTLVSQELLNTESGVLEQCDADEISYFINQPSEEQKLDSDGLYHFMG